MASPKHPHLAKLGQFFRSRHLHQSPRIPRSPQLSSSNIRSSPISPSFCHNIPNSTSSQIGAPSIPSQLNRTQKKHRLVSFRDFLGARSFHHDYSNRSYSFEPKRPIHGSSVPKGPIGGSTDSLAALSILGGVLGIDGNRRMRDRLKEYGFAEKEVQGDGNCQFRAIADQVYGDESKHREVRRDITDWLAANPHYSIDQDGTKLSDFLETDRYPSWKTYCSLMSKDGYWGDQMTLMAACELYKANVYILSSVETPGGTTPITKLEPRSSPSQRKIHLSLWHEKHYNSMYKVNQPASAAP